MKKVGILMGSKSDFEVVKPAVSVLKNLEWNEFLLIWKLWEKKNDKKE